jgi:hypothetical protein
VSGAVALSVSGYWRVDRNEGGLLVDLPQMARLLRDSVECPPNWRLVVPHLTVYGRSHVVGRSIRAGGDALSALASFDGSPAVVRIIVDAWCCRSLDRKSLVLPAESPGAKAESALRVKGIHSEAFHPGHVTVAVAIPPGRRVDVRTAAMWSDRCRPWNPSDGGETLLAQVLSALSSLSPP